jgi:hypothetical protein
MYPYQPSGSPCSQGEPNGSAGRFPSRSGGNLQEGGNHKLCLCIWYQNHTVNCAERETPL